MQVITDSQHCDGRIFRRVALPVVSYATALGTLALLGICLSVSAANAQLVTVPHEFRNGAIADANDVNENFQALEIAVNGNASLIDTIPLPSNTVVVANSGGDFDNVADAVSSITDAAVDNPYLVRVYPGVYEETQPIIVPGFVHLAGSGAGVTIIRRTATDSFQSSAAAVITLENSSQLSNLRVENDGASIFSVGILGFSLGKSTLIDGVHSIANGAGGSGHFAFFFRESDLTLRDCYGLAEGADEGGAQLNSGLVSTDSLGAFAQPRIERCRFEGNGGTGFGMQILNTAARVSNSEVFGSSRAISTSIAGITSVHNSTLRSFDAIMEQTGSATVQMAGVHILAVLNPVGSSSRFKYVNCFKGNYDPIVDGFGSDIS